MSIDFDGINDAKPLGARREFVQPGRYISYFERAHSFSTRANIPTVLFEQRCIKVLALYNEDPAKQLKAGQNFVHMIQNKEAATFFGNLKTIIGVLMDMDPNEVTTDVAKQVFGPDEPLTGMFVGFEARNTKTRKGTDFTVVNYQREVPPQEILEMLDEEERQVLLSGINMDELVKLHAEVSESA